MSASSIAYFWRQQIRAVKDEVVELRKIEDDISSAGMSQIRRLSRQVDEEVSDIRRIKGAVTSIKVTCI